MYITWVTFGYEHWKAIHDEIGRQIGNQSEIIVNDQNAAEFSDLQLSTKISRKVMMVIKTSCKISFLNFVTYPDFLVELEGLGTIYKDSDEQ